MENNKEVRLRFAPSPTGFLHIGNLRTALFGYLIAKSKGGKFILRLEDTDQKREVEGALKSLINIFNWIGLEFDEGPHKKGDYGPYIQTERLDIYNEYINKLLEEGKAYRCFCSAERLEEMREKQTELKQAPRYDRTCRNLSKEESNKKAEAGEKFVIRQKMPLEGEVVVFDEIRGEIKFKASDLDDQVLIKSNGIPTYQFANVIDDHLMKISHVTRGDEWLTSFPKNILLYQAFNWETPKFIHLPLLLNKGGGKLSKRQGDVYVEDYIAKGYLPEAIINFCALLGWHPKGDKEIFSLEELEKDFIINGLGSSPAIFDLEKLDYYNSYYIKHKTDSELYELSKKFLEEESLNIENREQVEKFIHLGKERLKKLSDLPETISFLFHLPDYEKELLKWKKITLEESIENLKKLKEVIESIEDDKFKEVSNLEEIIFSYIKENGEGKNGDYLWPLRVSLSGKKNSPSPFEIMWALGKDESLKRINKTFLK
ncbi:MAG: glutamate--tRNA ligase [Patescibacteria group bacterium]|jgi:glutamyl-tRNA synthetase|nr:glutamate--tRNA ligase [Patescibacteria group bacterium]